MGRSVPVTIVAPVANQLVIGGGGRIVFTSVIETTGVAGATVSFFDGNPATNRGLMDYAIGAGGSVRESWPEHGVPFAGDLWIGSLVGAVTLRIHVVPAGEWHQYVAEYWQGLANLLSASGGA